MSDRKTEKLVEMLGPGLTLGLKIFILFAIISLGWWLQHKQSEWPKVSAKSICMGAANPSRKLTCDGLTLQATGKGKAAVEAYLAAAEPGEGVEPDSYAQYLLAIAFKDALGGLPVSDDSAKQWLKKSVELGNPLAMQITHLWGVVPMGVVWILFFGRVEVSALGFCLAKASREPEKSRHSAIQLAYLTVPGAGALIVGCLAKSAFFSGAEAMADVYLSIVAAACLGSAFSMTLMQRADKAHALRSALEKNVNDRLTSAQRDEVEATIDAISGGSSGRLTRWQLIRLLLAQPELLFIDGHRR